MVIPKGTEEAMENILRDVSTDPNNKFKSFEERVNDLASKINEKDIRQILNSNKFLQIKDNLLKNASNQIERVKNYIDTKDVAAAFLELTDYMQTSVAYLRLVEQRMRTIEESDKYSPKQKLTMLHFAKKQADAYKAQVDQIKKLLTSNALQISKAITKEQAGERKDNALLFQLEVMDTTLNYILDSHT